MHLIIFFTLCKNPEKNFSVLTKDLSTLTVIWKNKLTIGVHMVQWNYSTCSMFCLMQYTADNQHLCKDKEVPNGKKV